MILKYKIFDPIEHLVVGPILLKDFPNLNWNVLYNSNEYIFMPYINVNDSMGKEIYLYDKVEINNSVSTVEFSKGRFVFRVQDTDYEIRDNVMNSKVIGNKYT